MYKTLLLIVACTAFACQSSYRLTHTAKPVTAADNVWSASNVAAFEKELEALRIRYHIPSLSIGIVNEKKLVVRGGLGYADIEKRIKPDENTVYQLASITKTFGSIILMQLVEQGKVSLDDPISKYGIDLGARWGSDSRIKVKHLLTHTAGGNSFNGFKPGYSFRYNGNWYGELGKVIEKASGQNFGELLMKNIIIPLDLKHTAPSTDDSINFKLTGYDKDSFLTHVAKPYNWQGKHIAPISFNYGFGPAAGVMSSVSDLAKYSIAIDEKKILQPATWEKIFTPFTSPKGKTFQYGLGWFVKYYGGLKIIWHTGWWFGYSTLLIKIPGKDLTFIILANSQDLSRPFYLTLYPVPAPNPFSKSLNKDLMMSDFASLFIRYFMN
ncbi:MAG: serine hydrolase domain-containing protein [Chitinophagaceae bacterium]